MLQNRSQPSGKQPWYMTINRPALLTIFSLNEIWFAVDVLTQENHSPIVFFFIEPIHAQSQIPFIPHSSSQERKKNLQNKYITDTGFCYLPMAPYVNTRHKRTTLWLDQSRYIRNSSLVWQIGREVNKQVYGLRQVCPHNIQGPFPACHLTIWGFQFFS